MKNRIFFIDPPLREIMLLQQLSMKEKNKSAKCNNKIRSNNKTRKNYKFKNLHYEFTNLRIYTMKLEEIKNVYYDIIYNYVIWNMKWRESVVWNIYTMMNMKWCKSSCVNVFTTMNIEKVWVQLCEHQPVMQIL